MFTHRPHHPPHPSSDGRGGSLQARPSSIPTPSVMFGTTAPPLSTPPVPSLHLLSSQHNFPHPLPPILGSHQTHSGLPPNSYNTHTNPHLGSIGPRSARPPPMVDIPPNYTLYCNNLNDKINKQELVSCLYEFFSPFGNILSIDMKKGPGGRGQAFLVFSEISSATTALRAQQGKLFLDKPIRLQYAKTKSDAVMKRDGNYIPRYKKPPHDETLGTNDGISGNFKQIVGGTLLVEDIPTSVTKSTLDTLFSQYPGHIETRLISDRGVAFIDFSSLLTAEVAMDGLQNFKPTPNSSLKISLSK